MCSRVKPEISPSASNWRSSWNVACLGASKMSGGPSGASRQGGAHFGETAEGLAAAGGAEEKARLHGRIFTQQLRRRKEIYSATE